MRRFCKNNQLIKGLFLILGVQAQAQPVDLNQVVTTYTEAVKRNDAFKAPYYGLEEDYDKFGDYPSAAYKERTIQLTKNTLEQLNKINSKKLSAKDLTTYKLFKDSLLINAESQKLPWYYLDFTQMGNRMRSYLDDSSPEVSRFPFDSVQNFDRWVKRSEGFLPYVDRQIAVLREGIKNKYVLNCVIAKKALGTVQEGTETQVDKNPFFRPLQKLPPNISDQDRQRLTGDFKMMIKDRIVPGFQKFVTFFKTEYMPHCRQGYGLTSLPRGKEIYKLNIRANTNLKLSADEIHKIGLKEVARIRQEIEIIKNKMGFKGTLNQFFSDRRANSKNYFKDNAEQMKTYNEIRQQVDKQLPKYFSRIPKTEYKIVAGENFEDATARYFLPTENMPYGRFVVNTLNLKSSTKDAATSLSLHEANPGHHLQLALQFEMKDTLSEYQRKIYYSNAFGEGWALYAEFLGREMGLFQDTEQLLGHLSSELWRAVRLVVDTGIHHKGWSRERVIQYMSENMSVDLSAIETEADRYSVWPGQALGYKMGQLKILELRRLAEKKLGTKFDIREFHNAVIGNGTVSLTVLEDQVNEWIRQKMAQL